MKFKVWCEFSIRFSKKLRENVVIGQFYVDPYVFPPSDDGKDFQVFMLFLHPRTIFLGQQLLQDKYKTNIYVPEAAALQIVQ